MMKFPGNKYITTNQALKYLRFRNITTIWRWLKYGKLRGIKKSGQWFIEKASVLDDYSRKLDK